MREYFKKLIKKGIVKVKFTKSSRYPIITMNDKLICENMEKYGFFSMDEFIKWYDRNF